MLAANIENHYYYSKYHFDTVFYHNETVFSPIIKFDVSILRFKGPN